MVVLENKSSVETAARQIGREFDVDFAQALSHLFDLREGHRDQLRSDAVAIDRERQVAEHSLGIGVLFGGGQRSVAVAVDARNDGRRHRDTRDQTHGCPHVVLLYGEDGGLQVFIEPVRGSDPSEGQKHDSNGDELPFQFFVSPRP